MAWFWVSNYADERSGEFIATGILRLRGVGGRAGWRYLFLIEGGLTLAVGIASFFMMPPGPTQTKTWFRPKGWFTERLVIRHHRISNKPMICDSREEIIMVNRILRDDPAKSDMHNREGLSLKNIWKVIRDWRLWPIYLLGLVHLSTCPPLLWADSSDDAAA